MAGKVKNLKRMKARLAGEADASVEIPFELICDCGETIRGVRRTRGIQKQCDQCGEALFVLPMNVYPATKSVSSEVIGGRFADRLKVIVGEFLPAKKKPQPSKNAAIATKSIAAAGKTVPGTAVETSTPKPKLRIPKIPRIELRKLIRRTFSPFRLVIISILCVVGLTGYWLTQQKAEEAARQVWLRSTDQIQSLLQDGKAVELEALLDETVSAGRVLGKADEEWRLTFNLSQETHAVNNLAASDLLAAFHSAYDNAGTMRKSAPQDITEASNSGVFVFDSSLRPDAESEGSFLFELPAAPGNQLVIGAIDLPQIQKYLQAVPDGRTLFSATVDSIVVPNRQHLAWRVKLDPASFVLLTNQDLCAQLGLSVDFDPDLESILVRQKDFVRQTETWEDRADDVLPEQSPPSETQESRR